MFSFLYLTTTDVHTFIIIFHQDAIVCTALIPPRFLLYEIDGGLDWRCIIDLPGNSSAFNNNHDRYDKEEENDQRMIIIMTIMMGMRAILFCPKRTGPLYFHYDHDHLCSNDDEDHYADDHHNNDHHNNNQSIRGGQRRRVGQLVGPHTL